jgi:hypothetical protein
VARSQVVQIPRPFTVEILVFKRSLRGDLVYQVQFLHFFLKLNSLLLQVELLLRLLWTQVRLVEGLVLGYLIPLPLAVLLDLSLKILLVCHIILLPQQLIMDGYDILFLFLPTELLALKVPNVFHFVALFLEPLVRLVVHLLQVLNVLLALKLRVVINLEGALRPHEVGVSVVVVGARDLLPTQREADQLAH